MLLEQLHRKTNGCSSTLRSCNKIIRLFAFYTKTFCFKEIQFNKVHNFKLNKYNENIYLIFSFNIISQRKEKAKKPGRRIVIKKSGAHRQPATRHRQIASRMRMTDRNMAGTVATTLLRKRCLRHDILFFCTHCKPYVYYFYKSVYSWTPEYVRNHLKQTFETIFN